MSSGSNWIVVRSLADASVYERSLAANPSNVTQPAASAVGLLTLRVMKTPVWREHIVEGVSKRVLALECRLNQTAGNPRAHARGSPVMQLTINAARYLPR